MAKRRRGDLEERLRDEVIRRVKGQHGKGKELADQIGRPPSWVTEYMDRQNHANLDTSLALMRYLGWSVSENLAGLSEPSVDPDYLAALRDEDVGDLLTAFLRLKRRPDLQATLTGTAKMMAEQFGETRRVSSRESTRGKQTATSTTRTRARRR